MKVNTNVPPDAALEAVLAKGARSQRQRALRAVHDICRRQYESGQRDFSIKTIGKLCEADGVMKHRSLYNAPSADYVALICAWAAYAGPPVQKPPRVLASNQYLMRIDDPALRSIMQAIIVERDKLKAQLNTVKANTQIVVDRRPLGARVVASPGTKPTVVVTIEAQLTDSERQALRRSVSQEFLSDHGWRETNCGEVITESGRTVFDPGYATAIRKILGVTI